MRMALGTTDGEPVIVEKRMRVANKGRKRVAPEMLRVRRVMMARMRADGALLREIGELFGFSAQNAHDQLKKMGVVPDGRQRRSA